jgi:hypothetical protein
LIEIGVLNSVVQGPAVANVFRVRSFLHFLSHCVAIAFFLTFFPLIGSGYAESGGLNGEHLAGYPFKQILTVNPADLPLETDYPPSTPLTAQSEYATLDQDASDENKKPEEKYETVEPITRRVPIWGEQAREKGYDLPLPFGIGTNLVLMDQGIKLRHVKVGIGDPTFEVEGLAFSDARAHDRANTARLDMWLLPFANLYGIFGYINGEAELDLDVGQIAGSLPIPGLPPIFEPGGTIDLNIDYNGTTFGGGMTLAGGYQDFFASVDANYTYSNIDVVDGKIRTYTISPRLGLLVDSAVIPGSLALWVGGMYMKYKQTVTDSINLKELDSRLPSVEIDFKLDIENEDPWNFLFGGQWEITKRWQFMAEGGMGDRKQLITGLFFRF